MDLRVILVEMPLAQMAMSIWAEDSGPAVKARDCLDEEISRLPVPAARGWCLPLFVLRLWRMLPRWANTRNRGCGA